ncbi:SLOG family protein [Halalkalibacter oceani]|uniref:SLOG family protein n=1 Tax=Halalkalibacter oceani TaxID=1653776 RepID=UPI0033978783
MDFDINKTACFTGHRPSRLGSYDPYSAKNKLILYKLRDIIKEQISNGTDTFITGMALGIDQWAARIVLKLKTKHPNVKLIAAIPCINHSNKWNSQSKQEWQNIIDKCDSVHYVSEEEYTPWCMQKRNEWMVDNSSSVIAVHDGSKGGTYNCIKYAERMNREIIRLNPYALEIS